jgi:hypothetical protein
VIIEHRLQLIIKQVATANFVIRLATLNASPQLSSASLIRSLAASTSAGNRILVSGYARTISLSDTKAMRVGSVLLA